MFVDSDDYIEPDVLPILMTQINREQLDALRINYQNVRLTDEGYYEVFNPYKYPHIVDKRSDVVPGEQYLNERMGYGCYAMQFIVRRTMVPLFTKGLHFEDVEWLPRMLLAVNRVNATQLVVYNYLIRSGSISHVVGNKEKVKKNVGDCMTIISRYNSYIAEHPACSWLRNMQCSMVVSALANVAQFLYEDRHEYISRLQFMGVFPLSIANQGRTYCRKARLLNVSPELAVKILHFKNNM